MHKRQTGDLVSLVLPAYNEEPNIRRVYDSIQRALRGGNRYRLLCELAEGRDTGPKNKCGI